ncbi:hypothetical protein GF406_09850 [candidate division KSB1 bacterium]|nr:hypothetical protein [candidate division KSB1 bacterium]
MKLLQKILVATSLNRNSDSAVLSTGVTLSKYFDSQATLLHVLPDQFKKSLTKKVVEIVIKEEFDKIKQEFQNAGGVLENAELVTGKPFETIIDKADEHDVNVIVIGASDSEGTDKKSLGFITEKVVRKAHKPVWVVKSDPKAGIRHILCAYDYSAPAQRALKNAIHLARRFQATLDVIHVIETSGFYSRYYQQNIDSQTRSREQKRLEKAIDQFDLYGIDVKPHIATGEVFECLEEYVKSTPVDLLVLGTIGRNSSSRSLIGSTAENVLKYLSCSVVTLKAADAIQLEIDSEIKELESHYQLGRQLMDQGFAQQAIGQFQICLSIDALYAPAWEAIAESYERLDEKELATHHRLKAKEIRTRLWHLKINAEIRSKRSLLD